MTYNWAITTALILLSTSVSAQDPPVAHHYFSKTAHEPIAKWEYSGALGPEFWGQLDPSYRQASSGKHQSPIDISTEKTADVKLSELKFDYRQELIASLNNGHTIQHNNAPGSFLLVDGERYSLEQYHVHAPSEHTIDGKQFDMEIHFVHKNESGAVAVVGVLVRRELGAKLEFPLYNDLPEKVGERVTFEGTRNPSDFLPRKREYFSYTGSFTTPPCTEPVRWIIMKNPISAPPQLIERFISILKKNNRPVQPLNDRVVEQSK